MYVVITSHKIDSMYLHAKWNNITIIEPWYLPWTKFRIHNIFWDFSNTHKVNGLERSKLNTQIYVNLQPLLSDVVSFGKIDRRTNSIFSGIEISIYFLARQVKPWQPFMLYWMCDYKYLVLFRSDLVPVDLGDRGANAPIRFWWD